VILTETVAFTQTNSKVKAPRELASGVTDEGEGGEPPSWQAKCKSRATYFPFLYLVFFWFSEGCFFLRFSGRFF